MNSRSSFYTKIGYVIGIAALLWPLHYLAEPPISSVPGRSGTAGGLLAQQRAKCGLSESQLGEIDPTSETMKLATFGMRGVAANILWTQANDFKMKQDWTHLSATLKQIAKLEPHFISVWRFQAWNLSYNVSQEFDDYRERFRWVLSGIDYLKDGLRYNQKDPRLAWDIGWMTSQKIGRSDEKSQFRRLYKDPNDFYGIHVDRETGISRAPDDRDNWLVGKEWFAKAEKMVDEGAQLQGMSPTIFYSDRPMCQISYSDGLERDGIFGKKAMRAWIRAEQEWSGDTNSFGAREVPTAYGVNVRLNDQEPYERKIALAKAKLDQLQPGLRDRMVAERRRALSKEEQEALAKAVPLRTSEQHRLAAAAEEKINVTHKAVADAIAGASHAEAAQLAKDIVGMEEQLNVISRYRKIVNFEYWRRRCQVEQSEDARTAREKLYDGSQLFADAKLQAATRSFNEGFAAWRKVLDAHKDLLDDQILGEDLMDSIHQYRRLLSAMDEPFPADFPLNDMVKRYGDKD